MGPLESKSQIIKIKVLSRNYLRTEVPVFVIQFITHVIQCVSFEHTLGDLRLTLTSKDVIA
jgi:hypothetical protein